MPSFYRTLTSPSKPPPWYVSLTSLSCCYLYSCSPRLLYSQYHIDGFQVEARLLHSIMPTKFKLNTGAEIPAIGFGTWQDEHAQEAAVAEAIKAGYRHIDTAQM